MFGLVKALRWCGRRPTAAPGRSRQRLVVESLEDRLSPALVAPLPLAVVAVNPQPIPPGHAPALVAPVPGSLVAVNPQPLPP
jgi:hypothetical protein